MIGNLNLEFYSFLFTGVAHVRMINNWLIDNGILMVYSVVNGVIYVRLLIRACV